MLSDALELTGNYFSPVELVLLIIGIVAVVLWVVSMWRRGGQYTGKMHRIIALAEACCHCALHIPDQRGD